MFADAAQDRVFGGRFRPTSTLKQAQGVTTLRAVDLTTGGDVVLKTAPLSALPGAVQMRLEHEADVLRTLDAPGLTRLLAFGREDGALYLAVPFVPGVTLEQRLARGPLSVPETLAVAGSVLDALAQAHAHGILHRDVKPANVVVPDAAPIRAATLIDFGLARSSRVDPSERQLLVGTARFMSPEQAGLIRRGVDERSDLYSLGALLYTCLAGRPPFPGDTLGEVLRRHLAADPPGLRAAGIAVPRALEELVCRLLRKDPRERYQSAAGAREDVRDLARALEAGEREPVLVLGRHDRQRPLTEPAFIGRAAELEEVERALAQARRGSGALVLVEAESGGGKSWFLDELARRSAAAARVLRGQAAISEAPRPLRLCEGVLDDLVATASSEPGLAEALRGRLGEHAATIAAAIPQARAIFGPVSTATLGPESFAETRVIAAFAALLDALGAPERPALVLLDDAQWADETTLRLLSAWSGGAPGPRHVVVVVAFRTDEVGPAHPLRRLEATACLGLAPFGAGEVQHLVASMAGPVPDEAVELVGRLSGGNPFMVGAVLEGMIEAGALVRSGDRWRIEPGALEDVRSSRRAAVVLSRRLERLPADTLRLLEAGAVLGKQFDLPLAGALAGLPAGAAVTTLDEARRRRVVWLDAEGTSAAFVHDKVREALLARLTEADRRHAHLEAARRIEAQDPGRASELAYHFDAAGEADRALPYARAAGAQARERHALEAAEAQYRIAERGAAAAPETTRLEVAEALGDVLMLRGRYDEAAARLQAASALASALPDRARLAGKLGELAFKRGDLDEARARIETTLGLLGHRVPRTAVGFVLACLAQVVVQAAHTLLPRLLVGRRPLARAGEDRLAARLYSRLAYIYWFQHGKTRCVWAHLREMNLAERYPPTPELAQAYSEHAPAMTLIPWFSRGRAYVERSLAIRRALGDRWGEGQSLHFYGVLLYCSGRLADCADRCREAIFLLERTGDRWEAHDAGINLALALVRLGKLEEAEALARQIHVQAGAIGDTHAAGLALEVWAKATGGEVPPELLRAELARQGADAQGLNEVRQAQAIRLLLAEDRPADAVAVLDEALQAIDAVGLRQEYVAPTLPWLATALRRLWEVTPPYAAPRRRLLLRRGARIVRRALAIARAYPNNLPHALREAGMLAAARGRGRRARRLLDASVRAAAAQQMQHERALSLVARGRAGQALGWPDAAADLASGRAALATLRAERTSPDLLALGGRAERPTLSIAERFSSALALGRKIATALTEEEVFATAREAALALLPAQQCAVLRLEGDRPLPLGPEPIAVSRALVEQALAARAPVAVLEAGDADAGESLLVANVRSALCAPILVRGRPAACLYLTHAGLGGLFGEEEERIASFVATLAGAALENAAGFSEVRALSEERARLYERTREALAGRDEFLSIASHELRTPMTSLLLRVESLLRDASRAAGPEPDRTWQRVTGIKRDVGRLQRLVDTLLDVSRVMAGRLDLAPEPVDLCALVRETAARFEDEIARARCSLRVQAEGEVVGQWDRLRLEQVLANLLTNALKYGAGRPVEIAVAATPERAALVVTDHGIGIAPEDQERIFERFERAVSARHYGGLGLGLWIVRTLVESQGGTIAVDSRPGEGATFRVELPRNGEPQRVARNLRAGAGPA